MKAYRWVFALAILLNLGALILRLAGVAKRGHVDMSDYVAFGLILAIMGIMVYVIKKLKS